MLTPTLEPKGEGLIYCEGGCNRPATHWVNWLGASTLSCDSIDCINRAIEECERRSPPPVTHPTPVLGFCKCCKGEGWFLNGPDDRLCPGCKDTKCEDCGTSEGVEREGSRTMYPPPTLTFWDRILLDGEEPEDPNREPYLCRSCAAEYHARWDEQWDSYNSGLL